jgi:VIT1/CCC1 family predicted Fe2+/Mn2+ transporter
MSAVGAFVPILPWFFTSGMAASALSLASAGTAATIIGGVLGRMTDGNWLRAALRQCALVVLAAGVTYEVGRLFHALSGSPP